MRIHQLGFSMVLALIGLSGCASTGSDPGGARVGEPVGVEATASLLGSADVGQRMMLPAGNDLGASEATVLSEYNAASGRLCRRVQLNNNSTAVRIVCKNDDGQWDMPRSLDQGAFRQLPGSSQLASLPMTQSSDVATVQVLKDPIVELPVDDLAAPEQERLLKESASVEILGKVSIIAASAKDNAIQLREVEAGETLWKFSQRVTGNALNWQKIAEHNDIDDARTVTTGMVLKVPTELLRADGQ